VQGADIRERMRGDGADPIGSSPAEFGNHLAREIAKWKKVVREAGISRQS